MTPTKTTDKEPKDKPDHTIEYTVDNEPQSTAKKELTVREILANAGDDPGTHYLVEFRGDQQIAHRDLEASIKLHQHMRFAAIFTGNTPVSAW